MIPIIFTSTSFSQHNVRTPATKYRGVLGLYEINTHRLGQ